MPKKSEMSKPLDGDLWSEAIERFRQNVKPEAFAQVVEVRSLENLMKTLSDYKQRYQGKKLPILISRSLPFLENLRSFCGVIDTMIQANPTIAALVWGSLKLILDVFQPRCSERTLRLLYLDYYAIGRRFIKGREHVRTALR